MVVPVGLRSLAEWASRVLAPPAAGLLLTQIDITGVMLIDLATFFIAMTTLLIVRIPRPTVSEESIDVGHNIRKELPLGIRYIRRRPGLVGLMLVFTGINFTASLTYFSILPAMILARTGGNELSLASVQSALGVGGVIGGIVLSVWGGPKRRIHGVFGAAAISFLFGDFLFAIGRSTSAWVIAALATSFFIPFIVGADTAIWQAKVPPDIQGRVFSARSAVRESLMPIGFLVAGPLADRVFEPAMMTSGTLVGLFSPLVGTGAGSGMALMFVCTSLIGLTMSVSGYLFRASRCVEDDLPDYDEPPVVLTEDVQAIVATT